MENTEIKKKYDEKTVEESNGVVTITIPLEPIIVTTTRKDVEDQVASLRATLVEVQKQLDIQVSILDSLPPPPEDGGGDEVPE